MLSVQANSYPDSEPLTFFTIWNNWNLLRSWCFEWTLYYGFLNQINFYIRLLHGLDPNSPLVTWCSNVEYIGIIQRLVLSSSSQLMTKTSEINFGLPSQSCLMKNVLQYYAVLHHQQRHFKVADIFPLPEENHEETRLSWGMLLWNQPLNTRWIRRKKNQKKKRSPVYADRYKIHISIFYLIHQRNSWQMSNLTIVTKTVFCATL